MTEKETINLINEDVISRERALAPYKDLNDDDVISVRLIKKNLTELPPVTQKPIECDDVISREDALKLIYDFKENHTKNREKHPINYGTLLDLIRLIRELPPVTPKCEKCAMNGSGSKYCDNCGQKSGRWVNFAEDLIPIIDEAESEEQIMSDLVERKAVLDEIEK